MQKVILIYGGYGPEKSRSMASANHLLTQIDHTQFELIPLDYVDFLANPASIKNTDVVFNMIAGRGGEDGELQDTLEQRGIRYTGSDARAMRLTWDKAHAKEFLSQHGIITPEYKVLEKDEKVNLQDPFFSAHSSYFIKPCSNGSSFDISKIKQNDEKGFHDAIKLARTHSERILIEKDVKEAGAQEYTVGIVDEQALTPFQITYSASQPFYTKVPGTYDFSPSEDIALNRKLQQTGLRIFNLFGCKQIARIDFICYKGNSYFLEINTIPAMREGSGIPVALNTLGITINQMFTTMIDDVL